jgi:hypothetical protein
MSIPTRFEDFNSSDPQDFGGSNNSDLAKGAWPAHMAKLRAERIAKDNRRAEHRRSAPPLALKGRDNLTAFQTSATPVAPVAISPTAQELLDRVVAEHEALKAEVSDLARALGRTG